MLTMHPTLLIGPAEWNEDRMPKVGVCDDDQASIVSAMIAVGDDGCETLWCACAGETS